MKAFKKSPWPSYTKEEVDAVARVLLSNNVNYWTGTEGRKFEKEFSAWCGVKFSVALMNGTVALDSALKALDIDVGDEVIVTSRTFIASISSIVLSGAIPVFADIDSNTQNITAESIREKLSDKTKAIICVHLAGWPCEMDGIMILSEKHGLKVIEDCAQAHGAKYEGKAVGSIGHIGCWSFCQDKIMTTGGEGGMVTTNDKKLWSKMWSYKDHGKSYESIFEKQHPPGFRWVHDSFGTNYRMAEMQAAIGRIQLVRMPFWSEKRFSNAKAIWDVARQFSGLRVPNIPSHITHAAYKCYVFVVPEYLMDGWCRDRILKEINECGVPCFSGSCSEVYLEKAFDNTDYRPKERLPVAKELGETSLMFLVHPTLTVKEIQKTCDAISIVMGRASI